MSVTRFRFHHDGRDIIGPVRGAGGFVASVTRLLLAKERAAKGMRLNIYEPNPGHVAVFPDYCAAGDGAPVVVPLSALVGEAK